LLCHQQVGAPATAAPKVMFMTALRLSGSRNHNHALPLSPPLLLLLLLPTGSCFGPVRDTFDVPA
jgi:hypothetical protein